MRRPHPALVAVLATAGVIAGAGPAAADGSLAPGQTQTVVVPVPDRWAADADAVAVVVDDLVQLENDCIEPEREAGDKCNDTTGELGDKLLATVAWGTVDDDDGCLPSVAMAPLDLAGVDGTPAETTRFEDVVGVECLALDLTFPDGDSDNVAQSDSLTFRLDAVGEEVPGEPAGTVQPEDVDPTTSANDTSGTQPQNSADASSAGAASARGAAAGRGGRGGTAASAAERAAAVQRRGPAGPMVGRVDAQVSVGADGISVETRAAEASLPTSALAWSSLLLGAVAIGWVAFVLVRRRRKDVVA